MRPTLAFALVLTACSAGKSKPADDGGAGKDVPTQTGTDTIGGGPDRPPTTTGEEDNENDLPDEPQQVTGAFLTGFGAVTQLPAGATVPAGRKALGLSVFNRADESRVTDFVQVQSVICHLTDGSTVTGEVLKGATAAWHGVFTVPEAAAAQIASVEVSASVDDGSPLALATKTFPQYDPEGANAAKPDFAPEIAQLPPAPDAATLAPVEQHVLFVSDGRYKPGVDFRSVHEAHKLCNKEANRADDTKVYWFKAILSDAAAGAKDRLRLAGASVLTLDGETFAAKPEELWGATTKPSVLTYFNHAIAAGLGGDYAWTGTTSAGTAATETCGDWSATTGQGQVGNPGAPASWLQKAAEDCAAARRLYCLAVKKR